MASVVMATAYGGPEVLSIADEPTPESGPGETRIEARPRDRPGQSPLKRVLLYRQFAACPGGLEHGGQIRQAHRTLRDRA